jgi:hypothetical protein
MSAVLGALQSRPWGKSERLYHSSSIWTLSTASIARASNVPSGVRGVSA